MCLHVSLCLGIYGCTWCWRKTANGLARESSPYVRARRRLKSCWFSNKRHLCHFSWPSWGCCTETADNFLLAWHDKSHKNAVSIKETPAKLNVTPQKQGPSGCGPPLGSGFPLQSGWPLDLLLFALVITRCSVQHSATHQQPRTAHRPGWSAPAQNPNK